MMTRRRWMQAAGAAGVAPWLARPQSARRPNILFCITDDQSYAHTSAAGCRFVSTPGFDRVAGEGILFRQAFAGAPSCCPSRGSVLTGQDFYRLREASMNHVLWPGSIPVYTDLLQDAGYDVGFTGKGWGPGNWRISGRTAPLTGRDFSQVKANPPGRYLSGIDYAANFTAFLDQRRKDTPFCFWLGIQEPHREFENGIGVRHGKRVDDIQAPDFLPDSREVRGDVADYAFEIEYADQHLGRVLKLLEKRGELENTLVVVTSDNGMAFPRAKGTCYEYGARMPLAVRWGARIAKPGRKSDDLVSLTDLAPTFLAAAGVRLPEGMTGRSLVPLLESTEPPRATRRELVVFGLERHFPGSRPEGLGYPIRAIRTEDYLYLRNLAPERNPMGDRPGPHYPDDDSTRGYGDTDGGPAKTFLFEQREKYPELYRLAFGRRPGEELYLVKQDPGNLRNVAAEGRHSAAKRELAAKLDRYLKETADPRATGNATLLDDIARRYPKQGSV